MTQLAESPVAFHVSVHVSNIDRSVEFFSKVFGTAPTKHLRDYAKFELQNPPITFSLEPNDPGARGVLNHLGFKFHSAAELVEVQRRLEAAGIHSEREEGVECCYSRQTKFWLHGPDGTLWEMYVLENDIEHRGAGQDISVMTGGSRPQPVRGSQSSFETRVTPPVAQWSHQLGSPLEIPEEYRRASLDAIGLQGTFNAAGTEDQIESFLQKAAEMLKPGGVLRVHCLTADRHVDRLPVLPGPASVVKSAPCLDRLMDALESAGFESVRLTTYRPQACFTAGDAELRETRLEAVKAVEATPDLLPVLFRGPFPEIKLDSGETLRRGRRTELRRSVVDQLKLTPIGELIVLLETATAPASCTKPS